MTEKNRKPGQWKKGQSGNPKGRPQKEPWQRAGRLALSAKERAEQYTDQAFKLLSQAVKDREAPMAARVSAANSILDRAYGKAPQDVTVKGQIEQHIIQLIQGLDAQQDQPESSDNQTIQ